MIHPLFHLLVTQPNLLADHADAYAELVSAEIGTVSSAYKRKVLLNAVQLCCLTVAAILAGVAAMLWAVIPDAQGPHYKRTKNQTQWAFLCQRHNRSIRGTYCQRNGTAQRMLRPPKVEGVEHHASPSERFKKLQQNGGRAGLGLICRSACGNGVGTHCMAQTFTRYRDPVRHGW